ncbi:MAG: class I SAM-dependent methyltransferase [Anaerolineae bacterium]|nr:class I SAM-dependent methyltransferase [Anaerolineae bacterium]
MIWFMLVLVALIAFLIWWLFFETEGVYLGRGIVVWLYDVYATRYDGIVKVEPVDEHLHLAVPIMQRIAPDTDPLVLDVATGTGRLPLALLNHTEFSGYVLGIDASFKMLQQAQAKLAEIHADDCTTIAQGDGLYLPFPNESFDVVTCMEALEFMPIPESGLHELVRVLRPGGLLLTTLRINQPWMPGKTWSQEAMHHLLREAGITEIEFELWQYDYTKVWGIKQGTSDFIGTTRLWQNSG